MPSYIMRICKTNFDVTGPFSSERAAYVHFETYRTYYDRSDNDQVISWHIIQVDDLLIIPVIIHPNHHCFKPHHKHRRPHRPVTVPGAQSVLGAFNPIPPEDHPGIIQSDVSQYIDLEGQKQLHSFYQKLQQQAFRMFDVND